MVLLPVLSDTFAYMRINSNLAAWKYRCDDWRLRIDVSYGSSVGADNIL